jgi:dTDP-4-dehydrorhamnose 3,5-epimerase
MTFEWLQLPGACLITLQAREDERGYFMRAYDRALFAAQGLQTEWVQENESLTREPGTIRGFHFQHPPHAETKLVRVVTGRALDVIVDVRKGSATFGQHLAVELSGANRRMLYVPKGFAHGFCSLEPDTVFHYLVDSPYCREAESGVRWDDPTVGAPWPVARPIVSEKDSRLPLLRDVTAPDVTVSGQTHGPG